MTDDTTLSEEDADRLAKMLDEPYEEYWYELGRFIHEFSSVESVLQSLVHHVAGIHGPFAKAIFHGFRVENAKDAVNRMLDADGQTERAERLKDPFAQLGVIAGIRNGLVHWGAFETSSGLKVSNSRMVFSPDRLREFLITPADLRLMRADLHKITIHFMFENHDIQGIDGIPGFIDRVAKPVMSAPWQYKPPQQSPRQKANGTRARRRARSNQRDA